MYLHLFAEEDVGRSWQWHHHGPDSLILGHSAHKGDSGWQRNLQILEQGCLHFLTLSIAIINVVSLWLTFHHTPADDSHWETLYSAGKSALTIRIICPERGELSCLQTSQSLGFSKGLCCDLSINFTKEPTYHCWLNSLVMPMTSSNLSQKLPHGADLRILYWGEKRTKRLMHWRGNTEKLTFYFSKKRTQESTQTHFSITIVIALKENTFHY